MVSCEHHNSTMYQLSAVNADAVVLHVGFSALVLNAAAFASPKPNFILACVLHAVSLLLISKRRRTEQPEPLRRKSKEFVAVAACAFLASVLWTLGFSFRVLDVLAVFVDTTYVAVVLRLPPDETPPTVDDSIEVKVETPPAV